MLLKRITAIHEAGHVVGRLLTAGDMGWSWDEAVESIKHAAAHNGMPITYGRWLSKEIDNGNVAAIISTVEDVRRLVVDAKARGVDVEKWARAKTLICVWACGRSQISRQAHTFHMVPDVI